MLTYSVAKDGEASNTDIYWIKFIEPLSAGTVF
jgi:hypothetical protein